METQERKPDRRIARTRHLLREALMEMVVEKGYDAVTIQDVADRANVARPTFYKHFNDKDDLLFTSMTEVYDQIASKYPHPKWEDFMTGEGWPEEIFDAGDFEHVAEYADFYRVMLSNKGSAGFIAQVRAYLAQVMLHDMLEELLPDGVESRLPLDMMAHYIAGAEIGLMSWWLENDQRYTPDEMARMMCYLTLKGVGWALKLELTDPPDMK